MTADDIGLVCVVVALAGVLLMCGAWAPLGIALAVVGWAGCIAGVVVRWDR